MWSGCSPTYRRLRIGRASERHEPVKNERLRSATRGVVEAVRSLSPVGRVVAGAGAVGWWAATVLGWAELALIAACCLVATAVALLFTIRRPGLEVQLELSPNRVVVGGRAVGVIAVLNAGTRRSIGSRVEVPVGAGVAVFDVPSQGEGESWDEVFVIPTEKRSVMTVGPAGSVRGDPLGLARRETTWGEALELFVHPVTVRLPGFRAGWMRDLEGQATNELSPSDVAFHALREYQPGDERRHVHWRTSARVGKLMVRQYVDTRRSHVGLVFSTSPADYADDDEFELAISIVGSIGVSALTEDQTLTLLGGTGRLSTHTGQVMLDGLAGVEMGDVEAVSDLARRAGPALKGASIVVFVAGSDADPRLMRAVAERYFGDVRTIVVQVVPGRPMSLRRLGLSHLMEIGALDDLPRMMRYAA